ncbi:MAG TPA: divergent polysaccharide deacetylase family protein, partial [Rhizomicrobium sp.]|nr:divergent polysaccharide deacetylase family protein [Rhizomicrobium sp.]
MVPGIPEIRTVVATDDVVEQPSRLGGRPAVAIVIDDLGGDISHTRRAIALPSVVALSFLPYPAETPSLAREGRISGHEILVHVPMEAVSTQKPAPMMLMTGLPSAENVRRLVWALDRVPEHVGINNHEGSRFTANRDALEPVMQELGARHEFFLDSRTTADTEAIQVAEAYGVTAASRDVFLDDQDNIDAVDGQLHALEYKA